MRVLLVCLAMKARTPYADSSSTELNGAKSFCVFCFVLQQQQIGFLIRVRIVF